MKVNDSDAAVLRALAEVLTKVFQSFNGRLGEQEAASWDTACDETQKYVAAMRDKGVTKTIALMACIGNLKSGCLSLAESLDRFAASRKDSFKGLDDLIEESDSVPEKEGESVH